MDFTQQQLADLTGVPIATLRRIEQGATQSPRGRQLYAIAGGLGVTDLGDVVESEWKTLDRERTPDW